MKKQDYLRVVRRHGGQFRADNIVISTETGELHAKGVVEVAKGRFNIRVTLTDPDPPPEVPQGIKTRKDFWTVQGVIEDEIPFSVRVLPSGSAQHYTSGQPRRSLLEFSPNRMELEATGVDCLTSQEIYEMYFQGNRQAVVVEAATSTVDALDGQGATRSASVPVTFHAVLPDFELIAYNGGTETTTKNEFLGESTSSKADTFHGGLLGWKYGLIQRDGDLHVHFISESQHRSLGEEHDRRFFHAFLQALAFTHGRHAWPFSVEHRRDCKLVTDRIQLHEDVADSPHAAYSVAMEFKNPTQKLFGTFGDLLEKAYTFFSSDSRLARESEKLLFFLREATARGIPKRIALLSLCSLLESLVRVIYEEEIAPKKAAETAEFQKVKEQTCEELDKKSQHHQRLSAILTNADSVNIRMRFEAVVEHLGLKPQKRWRELYGLWSKFRNPLSHRISKGDESEESMKDDWIAESRIAGAINCMILKLMNYSGYARLSAYEDTYGQI